MRISTHMPSNARALGKRFLIIGSTFNHDIVSFLVDGAREALKQRGAHDADIETLWVPGALEIPLVAKRAASTKRFDAIVCVGCVIKGGTDHYEHVCRATVDGIMHAGLLENTVITNGVLTVATLAQAQERAGGIVGNKGAEAADAAIDTLDALSKLAPKKKSKNTKVSKVSRKKHGR